MRLERPFHAAALAAALFLPAACGFRLAGPERSSVAAVPPQPARPVVLLLHGRGFNAQDTAALRREWLAALNLGLDFAGSRTFLAEDDFRLVWYADALDPRAPAARAADPCLGERAAVATGRPEREVVSVLAGAGNLLALAADWLREPEGTALRALAGDLLYFGNDGLRCAAEGRLAGALEDARREGRPVVLVAHSYGSLVAHSHLLGRDAAAAPRVERYVTIGSLIGRPELRRLLVGPGGRGAVLPGGVGSWVNVRDPRDPLAAPLMGLDRGATGAEAVLDLVTERPPWGDPHDAGRYLADPVTARVILGAWCATGAAPAEPACEAAAAVGAQTAAGR